MRPIVADPTLVAMCGLYCGACGAYQNGSCGGCRQSEKDCEGRNCAIHKGLFTCADCHESSKAGLCEKLCSSAPKVFGVFHPADRPHCLKEVRQSGIRIFSQKAAMFGRLIFSRP